ncbi:CRISPR-associated protein Cmr3 family [Nitrosospira multiformis]|uniref:CRISPR-associated protein Cmr3 family n=1 Tax=Nitrosospira multiformis TaxID=1231 RepID=A0A2T5I8B1_9PROT|nr:type III-B CRISPR module-associated Cmr3 family protein [Nitrosospira multiformis]PTQ80073.1 CRISPR-associated protein Cmr3 family [Nitrosospira multiformis]
MPSEKEPDLAVAGLALLIIFGLLIWYDKPVESPRPFDPYIQRQDLQTIGYSYESWLWQDPFGFDLDSYTERNQYYIEFRDKSEKAFPHHFTIHKKIDIEPANREKEVDLKKESEDKEKKAKAGKAGQAERQCEYQLAGASMTKYYHLRATDTLFIRGNLAFGESGEHGASELPPLPSLFAGAFRSAILGRAPQELGQTNIKKTKILVPLLKVRPNTTENKELRTRQRYAVIAGLIDSGYRPLEPDRLHFCSSQKNKAYDVRWEHYQHESKYNTNQAEKNELSDKPDIIVVWINSEIFKTDDNALTLDKFASGFENLLAEEIYIYDLNNVLDLEYRDKITEEIKKKNCKSILLVNPDGFYKKVPTEKLSEERLNITEELTKKLSGELALRKVKEPSDVMIITEQDSENARTLAKNFCRFYSEPSVNDKQDTNAKDKPTADDPKDNICEIKKIRNIFYLKGLDAYQQTLHKQDKNENQANKPVARLSAIDLDIPPPLPIGPSQSDYFHRLAKQINDVHKEINLEKRDSGIKAVGIFGSDFYDKLLILEALRAEMPNMLVFTTDLDAQMLHPQHWSSTRNLVVASHFDLLDEKYQKQFPSFRDSQQTNIFYHIMKVATNDARRSDIPSPRIFEIGRHGAVELDVTQENENCCPPNNVQNAPPDQSHLQREQRFPRDQVMLQQLPLDETKLQLWLQDQTKLLLSLVLGITLSFICFHWRIRPNSGTSSIYLLFGALTIFYIAFFRVIDKSEENLSFTDGISLWPSIFIQIIAILMAIAFFFRGKKELKKDFVELSQKHFDNYQNDSKWDLNIPFRCGVLLITLIILLFSIRFYVLNDVDPLDIQFLRCLLFLLIWAFTYFLLNFLLKALYKFVFKDSIDFNSIKHWIEKDNPKNTCEIRNRLRKCCKQCVFRIVFFHRDRSLCKCFKQWIEIRNRLRRCLKHWIEKDNSRNTKGKGENGKSQSGENESEQEFKRLWQEYDHYGLIGHRVSRVVAIWLFFSIIETILIYILPPWPLPCRGDIACRGASWASVLSFTVVMLLLFFILDAVRLNFYWIKKLRIQLTERNKKNTEEADDVFASLEKIVTVVAERTQVVDKLIYYPMLCIMLMLFARITYFDNQDLPLSKAITFGVSISLLFFSGFMLRSEAKQLKSSVIESAENLIKNKRCAPRKVDAVKERINNICEGAFEPMFEQPVLRALLIILASIGLFASEYLKLFE